MERTTWTDERLDDMVARTESQFEQLRAEMRAGFTEMREGFREVREELSQIRRDMLHLTIGMIGAFAALFATLFAAIITRSL